LSGDASQLTVAYFVQGVAAGMIIPIAQAYVGDLSPKTEEGKWQVYFNAAFFSGFGLGPLMGGALTDHFGMNLAFITMRAFNMLGFIMVIFPLPEPETKMTKGRIRPSFRRMRTSNVIKGLLGFRLAFSISRGNFAGFLPIYAGMYISLTATLIGISLASNIPVMPLLQPLEGALADKLNRNALVVAGTIANIAFLALL